MSRGRILAVDDQRYFRELLESLLREEGYEVQTVASGDEALRLLEHGDFDVVVTDLVMPVMSGTDLVFRIKEREPDQQVIVVTGVVDVRSAVEAMKVGASDYLLKPFERPELAAAVGAAIERSRLREDHDRLLAENLEFLSERALLDRALRLMSATSHEVLADKILAGLCAETGAQSGLLWRGTGDAGFRLAAVRGLVRLEEERDPLPRGEVPGELTEGAATAAGSEPDGSGGSRPCLWVAVRSGGELVAAARLGDKLGGDPFGEVDAGCAAMLALHAGTAYGNVERATRLERRTLQDPETGAYSLDVLHDVARNEIEKANRFGRRFGLLEVVLEPLGPVRKRLGESDYRQWHARLVKHVGRFLRSTDLLAEAGDGRICVLLAETDAVGASTFKQRVRQALERGEPLEGLDEHLRPRITLGTACYPGDATQLESLVRVLSERRQRDLAWRSVESRIGARSVSEMLSELLERGEDEEPESAGSLLRYLMAEVGRRPQERNLLFARPGSEFEAALFEGLSLRCDPAAPGELVVLGCHRPAAPAAEGVHWLAGEALEPGPCFAVQFGDGPPYVWVAEPKGERVRLFHSADRSLAEALAFRLRDRLDGVLSGGRSV